LLEIMAALGIKVRRSKVAAAWIGEKAGRLKANGRLFARSPLSNLEELELLRLGVEGKAAGWCTLRTLADTDTRLDPGHLDELISRARRQAGLLEDLRVGAADQTSGHSTTSPRSPDSPGSRPTAQARRVWSANSGIRRRRSIPPMVVSTSRRTSAWVSALTSRGAREATWATADSQAIE